MEGPGIPAGLSQQRPRQPAVQLPGCGFVHADGKGGQEAQGVRAQKQPEALWLPDNLVSEEKAIGRGHTPEPRPLPQMASVLRLKNQMIAQLQAQLEERQDVQLVVRLQEAPAGAAVGPSPAAAAAGGSAAEHASGGAAAAPAAAGPPGSSSRVQQVQEIARLQREKAKVRHKPPPARAASCLLAQHLHCGRVLLCRAARRANQLFPMHVMPRLHLQATQAAEQAAAQLAAVQQELQATRVGLALREQEVAGLRAAQQELEETRAALEQREQELAGLKAEIAARDEAVELQAKEEVGCAALRCAMRSEGGF